MAPGKTCTATNTVNNNKKDRKKRSIYKEDLRDSLNQYTILNRSQVPISNKRGKHPNFVSQSGM